MTGLLLGLQHEGEYPESVAKELRQLTAAIQQWANGTGVGNIPRDAAVGGSLTVAEQPAFRAFLDSAVTVASGTEQELTYLVPATDPTSISTFDLSGAFDGKSKVWLTLPGVYSIEARIRWDTNVAGTTRYLQMRIYGDDEEGDLDVGAPVASMVQHVSCIVRVSQEMLDRSQYPRGIPVNIEAFQDSGGARTLSRLSWFSVAKLF